MGRGRNGFVSQTQQKNYPQKFYERCETNIVKYTTPSDKYGCFQYGTVTIVSPALVTWRMLLLQIF